MEQNTGEASPVERLVRNIPGWEDRPFIVEPAIPVLASPSWRGVDGAPLVVRDKERGASLFVKHVYPDTAFYIDVAAAFDAATKAGEIGIGPRVIKADAGNGILVMEDLTPEWRVAGLEKAFDPAFVAAVLEKRLAFSSAAPLRRKADVFEEIERFYGDARRLQAQVPADLEWLVDAVRLSAEHVRGVAAEAVPIHGDGNVSNILVNRQGDVRLVDFDRAGNGDILEDLGSFFVEAFAFEAEARDAFYHFKGTADEGAFNRLRVYGIADDLRWGLIGALQAHLSPRKTNEFYKFASWRFLRCRMAVRDSRFSERLRRVS